MSLYGGGELRYKETNLKSGNIQVDFVTKDVDAVGFYKDSTAKEPVESPVLVDKGEEYRGVKMLYNFKTTRGIISYASTKSKAEESAYSGARINKVDKTTFFVENGIYTTCNAKEPHYAFLGTEMKVVQKEQMIGKWVWLTFEGVPFPVPLPFVVVPLQSGRRSGIIAPSFGESADKGRTFNHFGYFWATNDYMDLAMTGDYYTKGGYGMHSRYRYASRYDMNGDIEADFSRLVTNQLGDPDYSVAKDWRLHIGHNQQLTPSSNLNANLTFITQNYNSLNSTDMQDVFNNQISSAATYSKSWEETNTLLSISYSRNQDTKTGRIDETLPSMSFTKSMFYPFRDVRSIGNEKWYELLGLSYSGELNNNRIKDNGSLDIHGGIKHNIGVSFAPKLGYFNLTPSFSYQELWYNKYTEKRWGAAYDGGDSVISEEKHGYNFIRTYQTALSASTKIYGIFQPQMLGISAIRHILTPTISYNFTPDFSQAHFGYYGSYQKPDGSFVKYSKFDQQIFGGAPSGESQSVSFQLGNTFDMKTTVDPRDTSAKENKIHLLDIGANMSYDFVRDTNKFSDLSLNYRTQIGSLFNFSGSSNYTLYDYDQNGNRTRNFLKDERGRLLRLTNFSFSASCSFSGDKISTDSGEPKSESDSTADLPIVSQSNNQTYKGLYDRGPVDFSIPWNISLNYSYSMNKENPFNLTRQSTIGGSLNLNLTPKWKVSVSGSYDITSHSISAPMMTVTRDLHCWLMTFNWTPTGYAQGYQLQDLKLTKTDGFDSGR
jgi:lipopolysaccharide assembly outer membrane protein LptD (OstA)